MVDSEEGPNGREKLLFAVKTYGTSPQADEQNHQGSNTVSQGLFGLFQLNPFYEQHVVDINDLLVDINDLFQQMEQIPNKKIVLLKINT